MPAHAVRTVAPTLSITLLQPPQSFWAEYQTLVAAIIQAIIAIASVAVAVLAVRRQLDGIDRQIGSARDAQSDQVAEDRKAAALLIWAEVRTIERGCREWVQKWTRRNSTLQSFTPGDSGTPISVPLSNELYKSQVLRLAHFRTEVLEQITFFYSAAEVYFPLLRRSIRPDQTHGVRDIHREMFVAIELEIRANTLAALIYAEFFPGQTAPEFIPPVDLATYEPVFSTADEYLDFGNKEARFSKDAGMIRDLLRRKREDPLPRYSPDGKA